MREFLTASTEHVKEIWIDTDYGWVMRGDDFLHHLTTNEQWDWRRDLQSG
jgi:hypothetical protein